MLRHRKRDIAIAVAAATLAGYVDAIGFLSLGGFFVSFMSGNSTRLAVGGAGLSPEALIAARLILSFVAGVVLGSLIGAAAKRWRRPSVLLLVAGPGARCEGPGPAPALSRQRACTVATEPREPMVVEAEAAWPRTS